MFDATEIDDGLWVCGPCYIQRVTGGTYLATMGAEWTYRAESLGAVVTRIEQVYGKLTLRGKAE